MKEILQNTILPMHEQMPFGVPSESTEWYQHTFRYEGKPEVSNDRKAMVIMAHPDDESELAGGLIATLSEKGYQVTIVAMTDGRGGGDPRYPMSEQDLASLRLEESYLAAQILGAHRLINLGAPDGGLHQDPLNNPQLLEKLVKAMRQEGGALYITHPNKYNPTTVDYHEDHRNTTGFVERAIQLARTGNHALELGRPINDTPTLLFVDPQNLKSAVPLPKERVTSPVSFLLDITRVEQRKRRAFSSHASQTNNIPEDTRVGYVDQRTNQDKFRAQQMRAVIPYGLRRTRKRFAEGYGVHQAHGFKTDLSDLSRALGNTLVAPRRGYMRKGLPNFTR